MLCIHSYGFTKYTFLPSAAPVKVRKQVKVDGVARWRKLCFLHVYSGLEKQNNYGMTNVCLPLLFNISLIVSVPKVHQTISHNYCIRRIFNQTSGSSQILLKRYLGFYRQNYILCKHTCRLQEIILRTILAITSPNYVLGHVESYRAE